MRIRRRSAVTRSRRSRRCQAGIPSVQPSPGSRALLGSSDSHPTTGLRVARSQEFGGFKPLGGVFPCQTCFPSLSIRTNPWPGSPGVHALAEGVVGLGDGAVVQQVGRGHAEAVQVGFDLRSGVHDDRKHGDPAWAKPWSISTWPPPSDLAEEIFTSGAPSSLPAAVRLVASGGHVTAHE